MLTKVLYGVIAFLLFFTSNIEARIVDKIVAIINGDVITLYDLKKEIKKTTLSKGIRIDLNNKQMVLQFLSEIINKRLFLQEANKLKIEVSDLEVENHIKQIMESMGVTEEEFKKTLAKQDISIEDLKKDIKDNIKVNRLISYMVKSKVIVTDEDISNYIKENSINIKKGEVAHIIMVSSKDRELLNNIKLDQDKNILKTKGIQVVDVGEVFIDNLQPQWKDALNGVEKGNFTDVFKVKDEYLRLFVKDKKFKDSFDEKLKEKIKQTIYQKKLKQRYNDYISQLKSKSVIEIRI